MYYIYLDCSSSHPNHIKHSIVYSASLRARRLCSLESDFLKHCTKMKPWSLKACVRYFLSNSYFFTK